MQSSFWPLLTGSMHRLSRDNQILLPLESQNKDTRPQIGILGVGPMSEPKTEKTEILKSGKGADAQRVSETRDETESRENPEF